jgi:hypothetical protein
MLFTSCFSVDIFPGMITLSFISECLETRGGSRFMDQFLLKIGGVEGINAEA